VVPLFRISTLGAAVVFGVVPFFHEFASTDTSHINYKVRRSSFDLTKLLALGSSDTSRIIQNFFCRCYVFNNNDYGR
jgi:hypothetical protein